MPLNNKSIIKGTYLPPGDKSISHRILILTGQIVGKSKIKNLLQSEDVINTLKAMRLLGVKIIKKTNSFEVFGIPPGGLIQPKKMMDFGNSGTGIRLVSGLVSTNNIEVKLIGDSSLSKRPMKRVTEHLSKIGANIELRKKIFPPIKIKGTGNAVPLTFEIIIPSAQIKSAIMLSALNTNGIVKIKEFKNTRDHTENMLKSMGYNIKVKENSIHKLKKHWSSGIGSFNKQHIFDHKSKRFKIEEEDIEKISINTIRFKDLVEKYKIKQIKKLLIDVEGSEYEILSDIDFNSLDIKKILFEYKHFDGYKKTGKKLEETLEKLNKNGYETKKIDDENILAIKK